MDLLKQTFITNRDVTKCVHDLTRQLDVAEGACLEAGWRDLEIVPVHGDYNPWNLLFNQSDEVAAILDFDNCDMGPHLHDVAEMLITFSYMDYQNDSTNFSAPRRVGLDQNTASLLLKSYRGVRPFTAAELRCLPFVCISTMIELCSLGLLRRDFDLGSMTNIMATLAAIPRQLKDLTAAEMEI